MKLVVITGEKTCEQEVETLLEILKLGVRVHVRKPGWPDSVLEAYLKQIPERFLNQMSLHGSVQLAEKLGMGLHLKSDQQKPHDWNDMISKSFHRMEEIHDYPHALHYGFLSPIYDSISKREHYAGFTKEQLELALPSMQQQMPVYALGGITPDKLYELKMIGFSGVAIMGAIWSHNRMADRMRTMEKFISHG